MESQRPHHSPLRLVLCSLRHQYVTFYTIRECQSSGKAELCVLAQYAWLSQFPVGMEYADSSRCSNHDNSLCDSVTEVENIDKGGSQPVYAMLKSWGNKPRRRIHLAILNLQLA